MAKKYLDNTGLARLWSRILEAIEAFFNANKDQLKGEKGDTGDSGVYVGPDEPTNGASVWIDTNENPTDQYATKEEIAEILEAMINGTY